MDHPPPPPLPAHGFSDLARRWRCSVSTVPRKLGRRLLPSIVPPGSNRPLLPLDAIEAAERPRDAADSATTPTTAIFI